MPTPETWWNENNGRISPLKKPSVTAIQFERTLPRVSTIVDLGGGTGADTLHFLRQGHKVHLNDRY